MPTCLSKDAPLLVFAATRRRRGQVAASSLSLAPFGASCRPPQSAFLPGRRTFSSRSLPRERDQLCRWAERWRGILEKGWEGRANTEFVKPDYWTKFYDDTVSRTGVATFEWGGGSGIWRLAARIRRATAGNSGQLGGTSGQVVALHAGCGTSTLGAALTGQGWRVTNCDFCEEAVERLAELQELQLLQPWRLSCRSWSGPGCEGAGSDFAVGNVLRPPDRWSEHFDVVVEKGLADTLLFGADQESALERAAEYGAMLSKVLRPGGCLAQVSDAPLQMRSELLELILRNAGDGTSWHITGFETGSPGSSLLVAWKPQR